MLNGQNLNPGAKNSEPYTDDYTLEYDVCMPAPKGGLFISMSAKMNNNNPSGMWQCFDVYGNVIKEFEGRNWREELDISKG